MDQVSNILTLFWARLSDYLLRLEPPSWWRLPRFDQRCGCTGHSGQETVEWSAACRLIFWNKVGNQHLFQMWLSGNDWMDSISNVNFNVLLAGFFIKIKLSTWVRNLIKKKMSMEIPYRQSELRKQLHPLQPYLAPGGGSLYMIPSASSFHRTRCPTVRTKDCQSSSNFLSRSSPLGKSSQDALCHALSAMAKNRLLLKTRSNFFELK